MLILSDGERCFEEIAMTLNLTEAEVENECCRGPCKVGRQAEGPGLQEGREAGGRG